MRLRASVVSLVAIALLDTAVSSRSAEASCQYQLPCDELAGNCVVCTYGPDEPSTVQPYDSDGSGIEANLAQHPAADIARARLENYEFPDPPRPDVARSGTALHQALDVDDGAWGAIVDDLFARGVAIGTGIQIDVSAPSGGVAIPADQGFVRATTTSGTAVVVDAGGNLADPVDPITGEFTVEHVDLAFPSFGVSFAHRRVYRSRIDFYGPYGPSWDHVYNQRLALASSNVEPPPGYDHLPVAATTVPETSSADCGPLVILRTGTATALRFRETSRAGNTVLYTSDASRLRLAGELVGGQLRWKLASENGDVRLFDDRGLLSSWIDANGVGLVLAWEAGVVTDARLATVTDSVGRTIEYGYDGQDRLLSLVEPSSGLEARYEYGANGELVRAARSDGRAERYEYSVLGGSRGDWVPEAHLWNACADACAVSSSSCDAGGACDQAVADATAECHAAIATCDADCTASCDPACRQACGGCRLACETECTTWGGEALNDIVVTCNHDYEDSGAKAECDRCSAACEAQLKTECGTALWCAVSSEGVTDDGTIGCVDLSSSEEFQRSLVALGDLLNLVWSWLSDIPCWLTDCPGTAHEALLDFCGQEPVICCADGDQCGATSCNANYTCEHICEHVWKGWVAGTTCLPPAGSGRVEQCRYELSWDSYFLPVAGTPEWEAFVQCSGDLDSWSLQNGCMRKGQDACIEGCTDDCLDGDGAGPGCLPPCMDECGAYCDDACHVRDAASFCDSLDFAGTCEATCTEACVDAAHAAGANPGPKYGHEADLDFNLVRVYDGAGNLWLENTYGTDVTSPNFDTVTHQQFGAFTAAMTHVDLAAEANGDVLPPPPAIATLVDSLDQYESVEICPRHCDAPRFDPRGDLVVPAADIVLVFDAQTDESASPGGFVVSSVSVPKGFVLPTTTMRFVHDDDGALHGVTSQRGAKNNPLFDSTTLSLTIAMPRGDVTLAARGGGSYDLSGFAPALDDLATIGELTLLTDATKTIRAYPGHPKSVAVVTGGMCTKPFHFATTAPDRAQITPADACIGDLWVAPVASSTSSELGVAFVQNGQAAITSRVLAPTDLTPYRHGVVWRSWGKGIFNREDASSATAEAAAAAAAAKHYDSTPMLSMPLFDVALEPFYVCHHVAQGSSVPNDMIVWGEDPPPNDIDPACDPTLPDAPLRGVGPDAPGPRPIAATVVTDLHGAVWTFYSDRQGRLIRTVNHGTGAVWSFEHDPAGQVIGIEAPDRSRQCLEYDVAGNTTEVLTIPPFIQANFRPDPIRQRFGYMLSPSRLVAVYDPRDVTKILARYEYDTHGNLLRSFDANSLATNVTPVGGDGPARAMPYSVTDPSGAVHRFSWDIATGTVATTTVDATSTTPLTYEQVADEAGRSVWSRSPLGFVSTASYEGAFLTGTAYEGDGRSGLTTYGYDADGKVSTVTTGQHRTTLSYNAIGSLIGQRDEALDGTASTQVRCSQISPGGRVLESVTAEGMRTRYQYDAEGRVKTVEAGDLGTSAEEWDDTCPAHPPGPSAAGVVATFDYDVAGRLRSIRDARGYQTNVIVDGLGRPAVMTKPDGTTVQMGYDALGNVAWQSAYAPGANPSYRPPIWGDVGLLSATDQQFDAAGRLKQRRVWHLDHQGAPIGDGYRITTVTYDDVARMTTIAEEGARITVYRRDGAGRLIETKLADGSTVGTQYLDGGRTVRRTFPAMGATRTLVTRLTAWGAIATAAVVMGTTEYASAEINYDARLRPSSSKTASGAMSTTTYDAFDRAISITSQPGETATLSFDRDNRPITRVSAAETGSPSASWTFQYDAMGREWRTTDPASAVTETSYDGLSSLPQVVVDPRGTRFTYTWTSTGTLAGVVADANVAGISDVALRFVYDPLGRMKEAVRDDGLNGDDVASWFRYDSFGDVLAEGDNVFGSGATVAHAYDNLGLSISSTLGSYSVTRKFDALDRILNLRISSDSPNTATYAYAGLGGPMSRTLKNGIQTTYKYNALGDLTRIADAKGTVKVGTWTWEVPFDGVPRRDSMETAMLKPSSVFTVDPLARVTAEQHGDLGAFTLSETTTSTQANQLAQSVLWGPTTYKLTGRSSWRERAQPGASTSFTINARDAYTGIGSTIPSYDAAGALLSDQQSTYAYDAFGQLVGVQGKNLNRTYQRDALGRIVAERDMLAGGAVTRYAYDGLRQTFRKTPAGAVDVTIDGLGLDEHLVTLLPGGKRRYLEQDRLGSVVMVTDEVGTPLEFTRYTAFGEPTLLAPNGVVRTTTAADNRFGFQGHPHDWTTKLVDFRARHYRPTLGRFLTMDPLGLAAGSPSLYSFVGGAPLSFTDPLGLKGEYGARRAAIDAEMGWARRWLADSEARYSGRPESRHAFRVYRDVLNEIETALWTGGNSIDLKGIWDRAHAESSWDWEDRAWMHICAAPCERGTFSDHGVFGGAPVAGVDVEDVFDMALGDVNPDPTIAERAGEVFTEVMRGGFVAMSMLGTRGAGVEAGAMRTATRAEVAAVRAEVSAARVFQIGEVMPSGRMAGIGPGTPPSFAGSPSIVRLTPGSLPAAEEATLMQTIGHIDAKTTPPGALARKWGTKFQNRAGDLPGPSGQSSPYLEYRVAPLPGMTGPGPLRVVVNSQTGDMYYTWTHYGDLGAPAFVQIR